MQGEKRYIVSRGGKESEEERRDTLYQEEERRGVIHCIRRRKYLLISGQCRRAVWGAGSTEGSSLVHTFLLC